MNSRYQTQIRVNDMMAKFTNIGMVIVNRTRMSDKDMHTNEGVEPVEHIKMRYKDKFGVLIDDVSREFEKIASTKASTSFCHLRCTKGTRSFVDGSLCVQYRVCTTRSGVSFYYICSMRRVTRALALSTSFRAWEDAIRLSLAARIIVRQVFFEKQLSTPGAAGTVLTVHRPSIIL
jgi:hypothetical protein